MTSDRPAACRVIGRYALYTEIAAGGMATIHIGRLLGPGGFARTVAIKRMHPQYAKDPEYVTGLLDEARLAARIRHPNVVNTLDVVALSGELFLVMDYVHGETFGRLMKACRASKVRIPLPIVSAIMVGVLDGLHAAHEATNDRGEPLAIVHRDISPQNIMVGTDGVARVLDFGIAKASERSSNTQDGVFKGKMRYAPPEQFYGQVTRATDIYSASVVLWEALTGRRLVDDDKHAQALAQVLSPQVKPPSAYLPDLPGAVEEIVMRGLSVKPEARYRTAHEMARALSTALAPAHPHDLGEWLLSVAGDALARRAEQVAVIEKSTPSYSEIQPRSSRPPDRAPPRVVGTPSLPTVTDGAARRPYLGTRRGRTALVAGAVAAIVGVGLLSLSRAQESTVANAAVSAAAAPGIAPAAPPPIASPSSAPDPTEPAPAAPLSSSTSAAPAPAAPSPRRVVRPTTPRKSAGSNDWAHLLDSRK